MLQYSMAYISKNEMIKDKYVFCITQFCKILWNYYTVIIAQSKVLKMCQIQHKFFINTLELFYLHYTMVIFDHKLHNSSSVLSLGGR